MEYQKEKLTITNQINILNDIHYFTTLLIASLTPEINQNNLVNELAAKLNAEMSKEEMLIATFLLTGKVERHLFDHLIRMPPEQLRKFKQEALGALDKETKIR